MTPIQQIKYDILASLYYGGATIEELMSRDFQKSRPDSAPYYKKKKR